MTLNFLTLCTSAAAVLAGATAADAGILHFQATLRGAAEAPPNATTGKGHIIAVVDTDRRVLDYTVTYAGLTGPVIAAGLHDLIPGQADPAFPAPAPAGGEIHAVVNLTTQEVDDLNAGHWVFDIATAANPNDEIRGVLRRGD
jgi:hypothetical protein